MRRALEWPPSQNPWSTTMINGRSSLAGRHWFNGGAMVLTLFEGSSDFTSTWYSFIQFIEWVDEWHQNNKDQLAGVSCLWCTLSQLVWHTHKGWYSTTIHWEVSQTIKQQEACSNSANRAMPQQSIIHTVRLLFYGLPKAVERKTNHWLKGQESRSHDSRQNTGYSV